MKTLLLVLAFCTVASSNMNLKVDLGTGAFRVPESMREIPLVWNCGDVNPKECSDYGWKSVVADRFIQYRKIVVSIGAKSLNILEEKQGLSVGFDLGIAVFGFNEQTRYDNGYPREEYAYISTDNTSIKFGISLGYIFSPLFELGLPVYTLRSFKNGKMLIENGLYRYSKYWVDNKMDLENVFFEPTIRCAIFELGLTLGYTYDKDDSHLTMIGGTFNILWPVEEMFNKE